jgi:hypothetical protein
MNIRTIWNRPIGRFEYSSAATYSFITWAIVGSGDLRPLQMLLVPIAVAWMGLMIWAVNRRMLDVGINRRWVLPYTLLLLGAAFLLASRRWPVIVMAGYAALQAPLALLPSRRAVA